MNRRRLEGFRAEFEFRTLLANIRDYFQRGPNFDRKLLMALNASVQKLVDEVAETKVVAEAVKKGQELTTTQLTDLKVQVADLEAKLAAGGIINAEDLAAIDTAVTSLDETNEALKTAVPANTEPQP
jgi:predicted  nucleic acid-binding Zn-ribbon protein